MYLFNYLPGHRAKAVFIEFDSRCRRWSRFVEGHCWNLDHLVLRIPIPHNQDSAGNVHTYHGANHRPLRARSFFPKHFYVAYLLTLPETNDVCRLNLLRGSWSPIWGVCNMVHFPTYGERKRKRWYRLAQEITKGNFDWLELIRKGHFFGGGGEFGFGIVLSKSCSVAIDQG